MAGIETDRFEIALLKMIRDTRGGAMLWRTSPSIGGETALEAEVNERTLRVSKLLPPPKIRYRLQLLTPDGSPYLFPDHVALRDLFDAAVRQSVGVEQFLDSFLTSNPK